jgi:hypothetical protein
MSFMCSSTPHVIIAVATRRRRLYHKSISTIHHPPSSSSSHPIQACLNRFLFGGSLLLAAKAIKVLQDPTMSCCIARCVIHPVADPSGPLLYQPSVGERLQDLWRSQLELDRLMQRSDLLLSAVGEWCGGMVCIRMHACIVSTYASTAVIHKFIKY